MKFICITARVISDADGRFGIETEHPESGKRSFKSLTADRESAEKLAETINRCRVSDVHVDEMIEDYLG